MSTEKNNNSKIQIVPKEQKDRLKSEHGNKLKSLLLPLDDFGSQELEVLAIIPSRKVVGQAMRFMQSDPIKGQEILVKNCLLTSNEEVMKDDALFFAAAGLISDLMPIRQGKLGRV